MSIKNQWRALTVAGALGLFGATQASAHSIVAVTNQVNWPFAGVAQQIVPATTTAAFGKVAGRQYIVTFSGECAVNAAAGNATAWLDVDVGLVNAATGAFTALAPTIGALDAFCASNTTVGTDGWSMNSVTAVVPAAFPAGVYRAQVRARLNNGATGGWLGDRSLIVSF